MVTIEGTVERMTYSHEETHYTVAKVVDEQGNRVTVAGTLPGLSVGETIRLTGEWITHKKYGKQLKVNHWETVTPVTLEGIQRFLGSGMIKGIGPATAKKLVSHFGLNTLHVIAHEPGRLLEIEGIGQIKAQRIQEGYQQHQDIQKVMVYLQSHGVTPTLALKIYKRYGQDTIEKLEENPYRLADDIYGVGFKTADCLARQLGIPSDSLERITVGIKCILKEATEEGHVWLPKQLLCQRSADLLGCDLGSVEKGLAYLEEKREVFITEYKGEHPVYLPHLYHMERGVARLLLQLLQDGERGKDLAAKKDKLPYVCVETGMDDLENGFSLAPAQRLAVEALFTTSLLVVTGGPGTGKTTTIKGMITALKKKGFSPVLAAPTGRAAKRMTESTGIAAKTIHRLLEFAKGEGEVYRFQRNEEQPLEGDAFIVDEASMLDLPLTYHLLKALPHGAKLIFVGDVDQLPSVGVGQVLADLIQSGVIPVVRLTAVFRQAQASMIVQNAYRIQQGMSLKMQQEGDFFFIEENNPEKAVELIVDLNGRRLPSYVKGDPVEDIQVLSPMRRGMLGVENLNERLQEVLNPPDTGKAEIKAGGRMFRQGDKVMQVRNNYQKEIFNGDVGRISKIDEEEGDVYVSFPDIPESREIVYGNQELDELALAYAVTVHKSQGSEYPAVIVPLAMQHYRMLQRNLLYTAVTRAKKLLVLVGQRQALAQGIGNGKTAQRFSLLAERLKGSYKSTM